jgi:hypothetical protein
MSSWRKVDHDHEQEAWCEEFATMYRFETRLDMSVCTSVARSAYRMHGSYEPMIAVKRLLDGRVSRTALPFWHFWHHLGRRKGAIGNAGTPRSSDAALGNFEGD